MKTSLVAFNVNPPKTDPEITIGKMDGSIASLTKTGDGVFDVNFTEEMSDKFYHVTASFEQFLTYEIRNRTTTGFLLHVQNNGEDANPGGLCTVTVFHRTN